MSTFTTISNTSSSPARQTPKPKMATLSSMENSSNSQGQGIAKVGNNLPPVPPPQSSPKNATSITNTLPPAVANSTAVKVQKAQAGPPQKVKIIYNMYKDMFTLSDGLLTAAEIDEEYCLSDVMPACTVHLSQTTSAEYTKRIQRDPSFQVPYEKEEPVGTFTNLVPGVDYYVWVVQKAEELELAKLQLETQCQKLQDRVEDDETKHPQKKNMFQKKTKKSKKKTSKKTTEGDFNMNESNEYGDMDKEDKSDEEEGEFEGFDEQYAEFDSLQETWGENNEDVDEVVAPPPLTDEPEAP